MSCAYRTHISNQRQAERAMQNNQISAFSSPSSPPILNSKNSRNSSSTSCASTPSSSTTPMYPGALVPEYDWGNRKGSHATAQYRVSFTTRSFVSLIACSTTNLLVQQLAAFQPPSCQLPTCFLDTHRYGPLLPDLPHVAMLRLGKRN